MNNTETCLNCSQPYTKCQFNSYHQRYCFSAECRAVSKKMSQKKWYEKTKLINSQDQSHQAKGPAKSGGNLGALEKRLAMMEVEIIKSRDLGTTQHHSLYDLLFITLGFMMHLTGDDSSEISPEIIGSRCKKFYLLAQDAMKRPDLMLTTIWDFINNAEKTDSSRTPSPNTS